MLDENKITTFLADESHDQLLRGLMERIAMPGRIELVYAREPSFFHGVAIQGKFNQVGVCFFGDRIAGAGCRSIRPMYLDGCCRDFGYLSGLRADLQVGRGITQRIFSLLKEVHQDNRTNAYLMTIIEGNDQARGALVRRHEAMPFTKDLGRYRVYAVNFKLSRRPLKRANQPTIIRGDQVPFGDLLDFINRQGAHRQFFPAYAADDFGSPLLRGLTPADFLVAISGNEILGTLARWDQRSFKQHRVIGYHGLLSYGRSLVNCGLKLAGYCPLPAPNQMFSFFYASSIVVRNDDPGIFAALFDELYQSYQRSGYHFIMIGFHEKDPLAAVLENYPKTCYESRLYLASWEEQTLKEVATDHRRIPYLELGTL